MSRRVFIVRRERRQSRSCYREGQQVQVSKGAYAGGGWTPGWYASHAARLRATSPTRPRAASGAGSSRPSAGREVVRQEPPRHPGTQEVENGVHQLTTGCLPGPTTRFSIGDHGRNERPLRVRQVRPIGATTSFLPRHQCRSSSLNRHLMNHVKTASDSPFSNTL